MRAVEVQHQGGDFVIVQRDIPEPKDREVLIKVEACGICHGDAVAKYGTMTGISYPRIPGHEVVGFIEKVGSGVSGWAKGRRVGVGWSGGHCMVCNPCLKGDYQNCENSLVTGLSADGGYAEYMVARASALISIPDELTSENAAPLLCAGATTFSALKHSGAHGGDVVAIHGIGGLGHLAIQYSAKLGFKTVALSRGKDKEQMAIKLGAHLYIDTDASDPVVELQKLGGARVIIATAPNTKAIAGLINGLGMNGQIIIVAGLSEPMQVIAGMLFKGGRSIKGWTGQRPQDAVNFSVLTKVLPLIETFPLEKAEEAFTKMMNARVRFRSVLVMQK